MNNANLHISNAIIVLWAVRYSHLDCAGLCAIRKKTQNAESLYYVLKDNMNSVQIVTDEQANILNEWHYAPWCGRLRIDNMQKPDITDRGYTGHEHLTALGLINMNGRIYDPVLARFLSPRPIRASPRLLAGVQQVFILFE
jgi:RHS repeat-associated protein